MPVFRKICAAAFIALLVSSCSKEPAQRSANAFPILTPATAQTPRINGAPVFGVRPGSPFFFQIPVTGARPMVYSAAGLPAGLTLDDVAGRITGTLTDPGRHVVRLRAQNNFGAVERTLMIVVGDRIALTPPMGWNSWNCWGGRVTEKKVRAAARAFARLNLREHGWTFINVDDGWQGIRGGEFNAIQPNRKFPDMPGLAKEVHALGLKFGLYSTPWRTSFYGHIGSSADHADGSYDWIQAGIYTDVFRYRFPEEQPPPHAWLAPLHHWLYQRRFGRLKKQLRTFGKFSFVKQDARQWAAWGVDYLKYDWVPIDLPHTDEMRQALLASGRDVVFSVANNARLEKGPQLMERANSWRTATDVKDTWQHIEDIGFSRDKWAPFNGPGHYNDPDMLVIGQVGWDRPRPTRLTSDEQYTQVSLWCLMSAPLLLGCDLEKADAFTLGLITNDEVLAIDQDSLGKQATRVAGSGAAVVYAKPLDDGAWAAGLFNRGNGTATVRVKWKDLGLAGKQRVRDLWRQQDLGIFEDSFEASVGPHGVVLIRVASPNL